MQFNPKLIVPASIGLLSVLVLAGCSGPSSSTVVTEDKARASDAMPMMPKDSGHHDETIDHHQNGAMQGHDGGRHQHQSWQNPPARYAGLEWSKWEDPTFAKNGRRIYQQQCLACHGDKGKGDGIAGRGLPHPPADLTNHFHTVPGDGDGYLFWRVSEGGLVEPFKSMQSSMPAFVGILSEDERWSVLTYVHQEFHRGFKGSSDTHDAISHSH